MTFLEQLDCLIRARYPLLYVVTWEEERARRFVQQLASQHGKNAYEWSITDGLRSFAGSADTLNASARTREPLAALNEILQANVDAIYMLKDFHKFIEAPEITRQLRDLSFILRHTRKTVLIVSPVLTLPPELEKSFTVLDMPLPTYDELRELLERTVATAGASRRFRVLLTKPECEAVVKAAQGLTLVEAENAFAQAIVRDNVLDAQDIEAISSEKRQVIRKSGLLEYYDVSESLTNVGGMDLLKDWLSKRARAFTAEARQYGLPQPRGLLLMGVQGCGKSLMAKAIAAAWRLPLLRMDMSMIFQSYIGSSEQNMRRALKMAETLAPIVLWIDEIEKALSGMEGSGSGDSGTTARVVGSFLTWLQEKSGAVFVVATANEVRGLPPELLRKGRFDEVFFVDLPRSRERAEVFQIHLKRFGRDPAAFDMGAMVRAAAGFSGSEIEQAIISALHDSFFAARELQTADVVASLQETVPLSRTMSEKIEQLRAWAQYRARPVSSAQKKAAADAEHGSL